MRVIYILVGLLLFSGCNQHKRKPHSIEGESVVHVLVDVTDPQKLNLWPNPVAILRLFHCDIIPDQASVFKLQAISDISINQEYQAYLPTKSETEKLNITDDIQHRRKNIIYFYDSVKALFKRFYSEVDTTISRNYSECWAAVTRNLEELSQTAARERMLIVFSDLSERSSQGNAYSQGATISTEVLKKSFEKSILLSQKTKGIKLVVVYQPINRDDDARFGKMFQVYKKILEAHGVIVNHQTSNERFD